MLNIGGAELLIILLVALIVLGPGRLPEVARQLGQTMSTLRGLARSFQTELEAAARPDGGSAVADAVAKRNEALAAKAREVSGDPFAESTRDVSPGGPAEAAETGASEAATTAPDANEEE